MNRRIQVHKTNFRKIYRRRQLTTKLKLPRKLHNLCQKRSPFHLVAELTTEHVPELMPEPLEGDEDVAERSEMLTDCSDIKAKSGGAASVASMSTIHPDVIKHKGRYNV